MTPCGFWIMTTWRTCMACSRKLMVRSRRCLCKPYVFCGNCTSHIFIFVNNCIHSFLQQGKEQSGGTTQVPSCTRMILPSMSSSSNTVPTRYVTSPFPLLSPSDGNSGVESFPTCFPVISSGVSHYRREAQGSWSAHRSIHLCGGNT